MIWKNASGAFANTNDPKDFGWCENKSDNTLKPFWFEGAALPDFEPSLNLELDQESGDDNSDVSDGIWSDDSDDSDDV